MHGLTQGGPIRVVYRGQSYNARVVAKDHANDVAILEIDQDVFTPADFATQDSVSVGSFAMAVGTPHGFTDSVSIGSISAKNRTLPSLPGRVFIQTDTAINPGNSGGALVCIVNGRPKVVGMNARIYSKVRESNGLGFAIPTDVLQAVQ
jgi:serine protease Do